jgi:hypothetical protein
LTSKKFFNRVTTTVPFSTNPRVQKQKVKTLEKTFHFTMADSVEVVEIVVESEGSEKPASAVVEVVGAPIAASGSSGAQEVPHSGSEASDIEESAEVLVPAVVDGDAIRKVNITLCCCPNILVSACCRCVLELLKKVLLV